MIGAGVWNAGPGEANGRAPWWAFFHDAVALDGGGTGGWVAIVAWWAAVLGVIWFAWSCGSRVGAAAIVATPLVLSAAGSFTWIGSHPAATAASLAFVTTAVVAVAARVPHEVAGSERLLRWVTASVGMSWVAVVFEAVFAA